MKFFQKRWVAVLLCLAMIGTAIGVSVYRNQNSDVSWGESNYDSYTKFVNDEAGMLNASTIEKISSYNAQLDYRHGSICALATVNGTDGETLEDLSYALSEDMKLGEQDALLVLDIDDADWYFVYGSDFSYYVDHELEVLLRGSMTDAVQSPNSVLPKLYGELADWYDEQIPVADQNQPAAEEHSIELTGMQALLIIAIIIIVFAAIFSRPRRRFGWGPVIFLGGHRHRPHYPPPGPRTRPGPGPGPGPGSRPHHSDNRPPRGGSSGGFGGSSRGSGFSRGGGGGFGGSSRGGGFGGSRK